MTLIKFGDVRKQVRSEEVQGLRLLWDSFWGALPGPGFDPTPSACEEFCFFTSHTKYGETIKSMGQDSNRSSSPQVW